MAKTFTYSEVKDMIHQVFETYDICNTSTYDFKFETWLNNQWLNWNNGTNKHLLEKFLEDEVESFIY